MVLRTILIWGNFLLSLHAASLYQDPLAKPYYELQFSKTSISGAEAASRQRHRDEDYKYKILNDGKSKYLCAVPNITSIAPEPSAQAEMEESQRASQKGWELLRGLEGTCLYWMSGWWTYKFCYSDTITQFHALPPVPGTAMWPPKEDPAAGVYLLGKRSATDSKVEAFNAKDLAKFKTNGESKSLVVNYEKGSYCPIIGAERKTEVQFQCVPTTNDRIAFVKEITSCRYMIVIQTARLCHDVAFQESAKGHSNTIQCDPINDTKSLPVLEAVTAPLDASEDQDQTIAAKEQELRIQQSELIEDLALDEKVDQELAHLAFDGEPPKLPNLVREKGTHQIGSKRQGGQKPPAPTSNEDNEKLATAVEMAKGIANQLEDGSLQVSGQSIFDKDNKDVEFQVDLQDENGESLGSVIMKVLDGSVVIELEDELATLAAKQEDLKIQEENKKASERLPEHVRANFERFVGHDEL